MKFLAKMRTFGSIWMVIMLTAIVVLLSWAGKVAAFTWGSVISMLLTAVLGSILVAIITPKKEKLWAYVIVFLIVMLVNIVIGVGISYFQGLMA